MFRQHLRHFIVLVFVFASVLPAVPTLAQEFTDVEVETTYQGGVNLNISNNGASLSINLPGLGSFNIGITVDDDGDCELYGSYSIDPTYQVENNGEVVHEDYYPGYSGDFDTVAVQDGSFKVTIGHIPDWHDGSKETVEITGNISGCTNCQPVQCESTTVVYGEWGDWELTSDGRLFRYRTITYIDANDGETVCGQERDPEYKDTSEWTLIDLSSCDGFNVQARGEGMTFEYVPAKSGTWNGLAEKVVTVRVYQDDVLVDTRHIVAQMPDDCSGPPEDIICISTDSLLAGFTGLKSAQILIREGGDSPVYDANSIIGYDGNWADIDGFIVAESETFMLRSRNGDLTGRIIRLTYWTSFQDEAIPVDGLVTTDLHMGPEKVQVIDPLNNNGCDIHHVGLTDSGDAGQGDDDDCPTCPDTPLCEGPGVTRYWSAGRGEYRYQVIIGDQPAIRDIETLEEAQEIFGAVVPVNEACGGTCMNAGFTRVNSETGETEIMFGYGNNVTEATNLFLSMGFNNATAQQMATTLMQAFDHHRTTVNSFDDHIWVPLSELSS